MVRASQLSTHDPIEKAAGATSRRLVRTFEYEHRFRTGGPNTQRATEGWKATPGGAPRKRQAFTLRSNGQPVVKDIVLNVHARS